MADRINLNIDGREVDVSGPISILQAAMADGTPLTANVGCLGQGVCGACRCLVRRDGERAVTTALACETPAEAGMQVSFVDYFTPQHSHVYAIDDIPADGWYLADTIRATFPEAAHCRHCSGCDRACPKGLSVQEGVARIVDGDIAGGAEIFDQCVMCNLCTLACPELIRPNHLGLMARRATAARTLRPSDLIRRLDEIARGAQSITWPDAVNEER